MTETPSFMSAYQSSTRQVENGASSPFETIAAETTNGQIIQDATSSRKSDQEGDRSKNSSPNIHLVVSRAKKAAVSLWTALHAQNCNLPSLSQSATRSSGPHSLTSQSSSRICCLHPGCEEMKKILLHVKACPSAFDEFPCPTNVQGCQSVRKLFNHYKSCREIRRQQSFSRLKTSETRQQHQCLVCSLVARHARTVLDGGRGPMTSAKAKTHPKGQVSMTIPAKVIHSPNAFEKSKAENIPSPTHLPNSTDSISDNHKTDYQPKPNGIERTDSMLLMPPPPPRAPMTEVHERGTFELFASPPPLNQLRHPSLISVADATRPIPLHSIARDPDSLGKSFDSSSGFESRNASGKNSARIHHHVSTSDPSLHQSWDRQRSLSIDERRGIKALATLSHSSGLQSRHNDDVDQFRRATENEKEDEKDIAPLIEQASNHQKVRRSSSCGVLSSLASYSSKMSMN